LNDKKIMKELQIDATTLKRFKLIQKQTILEAKKLFSTKKRKLRVLGISSSARDEFDYAQEKSNSETLLIEALDECKKLGAETQLVQLRKFTIKPCKACYSTTNTQCHYPCSCYPKGTEEGDGMSNILYDKVIWADAIIFATPVNNFDISTHLKLFIDRCISLDGSLAPADPKHPKDVELNTKQMKFIELTAKDNIMGSGLLKRFWGKVAGIIVTGHEEGGAMAISNLFMTLNNAYGMVFPPVNNVYAMSSISKSTYEDKPIVTSDYYKKEVRILAKNIMLATKELYKKKAKWIYSQDAN